MKKCETNNRLPNETIYGTENSPLLYQECLIGYESKTEKRQSDNYLTRQKNDKQRDPNLGPVPSGVQDRDLIASLTIRIQLIPSSTSNK